MSNDKITVHWQVHGQGEMEINSNDVEGMSPDEIEGWVMDGVHMEIIEQGNYHISLSGLEDALEKLKED